MPVTLSHTHEWLSEITKRLGVTKLTALQRAGLRLASYANGLVLTNAWFERKHLWNCAILYFKITFLREVANGSGRATNPLRKV